MALSIILLCGHGAGDPGAVNKKYNLKESDLTREQAKQIKAQLEKYKDVTVTIFDTNKDAFQLLQQGKAPFTTIYDYVLELHFNAHSTSTAQGAEVIVTTKETIVTVENKILTALSKWFSNRGVKKVNNSVIWWAKNRGMSSALLETCFISNDTEIKKYQDNKTAINNAIADAIASGFGLVKKPTTTNPPTTSFKKVTVDGKSYWDGGTKFKMLKGDSMYDNKELSTTKGNVTGWYFEKGSTIFADAIVKDSKGRTRLVMYTGDKGQNPRYLTLRDNTVERLK